MKGERRVEALRATKFKTVTPDLLYVLSCVLEINVREINGTSTYTARQKQQYVLLCLTLLTATTATVIMLNKSNYNKAHHTTGR